MGSLTLGKDGNVLYTRSFGYSQINGTEKKSLTATTRYRIGSITKTFTAVMIVQLVEEGRLKLTDSSTNSSRKFRTPPESPSVR